MDVSGESSVLTFRLNENTKKSYERCVASMETFFRENNVEGALSEGKISIPMKRHVASEFLESMASASDDGTVYSYSTLNSYICAIKNLYREKELGITPDLALYFKNFCEGYKRIIAKKKEDGIMKNREGKLPISHMMYKKLAVYGLKNLVAPSSSFVHLYMLLCWNMFARFEVLYKIMYICYV